MFVCRSDFDRGVDLQTYAFKQAIGNRSLTMKAAIIYTLKVWLTALALSLIGSWEIDFIYHVHSQNYFYSLVIERIIAEGISSLYFALPFGVCVWFLHGTDWKVSTIKLVLTGATFLLAWIPLMVLTIGTDDLGPASLFNKLKVLGDIVLNWICIWFYQFKPVKAWLKTPINENHEAGSHI